MRASDRAAALRVALLGKDLAGREAAAVELCELAARPDAVAAEFTPDVPRLLADPSEAVRVCGLALAATVLPPGEALTLLAAHATDANERLRLEVAGRLADMAVPGVRPALAGLLADPSWAVRFEAARGIAALGHPAGLDTLIEALDRPDFRFRGLGALAELGDPRALEPVRRIFKKWFLPPFERTQAAGVLARLGDARGGEHLLRVAGGRWSADRAMALELLGELKVAGAFDALSRAVQNPKDACRGAAARGLGRLGDGRALPLLAAFLDEAGAPEDFRLDAAEGLCRLGTAEALAKVKGALAGLGPQAEEELRDLLAPAPASAPGGPA